MGYLLIDHKACGGKKQEFDTVSCKHCQKVIKIYIRGCTKEVGTKYRCQKCFGPICKRCAIQMERNGGECNAPLMAKIDKALKTGRWSDNVNYRYRGY